MVTADKDPLTGAYTRAVLRERLEEELAQSRRLGTPLSILFLDVDYFKSINDAFGHATGDDALKGLVQRLRRLTRKSDLLFRYGGDEFVLVMPGTAHHQVPVLSKRLLESLETEPLECVTPPLHLSISGGTATFPTDEVTLEALFAVADRRHYTAKRQGRGRIITTDIHLPKQSRPITPPDRLIGSDEALGKAQDFLNAVGRRKRGVLQILAEANTGQPDVLKHIRRLARLHGYLVMHLRPSRGMQKRLYGAMWEAEIFGIPTPSLEWGNPADLGIWQKLAGEKHAAGWVLLVENWENLDSATQGLLETLLTGEFPLPVGLVYTTAHLPAWKQAFPWNTTPRYEATLEPLSVPQTRVWLRQALKWEPPAGFVARFHEVTGGKPGLFLPVLESLQSANTLVSSDDGHWTLAKDYADKMSGRALLPQPPPLVHPPIENTFIGHHRLIAELRDRLQQERLTSIIAPGGTGKTRLALQLLVETGHYFSDGAFFVMLDGVNAPEHIPEAIAATLRLSLDNRLPLGEALCEALRKKNMLLVLDNFEHLSGGERYIQQLLKEANAIHILVTSRVPLNLPQERRVFLQGLSIPPAHCTPETFDASPAVRFFITNLQQQGREFQLTEENRPLVAKVCRLSGGMPLALQMAAAWYALIPLDELVQRVEHNLGMMVLQNQGKHKPERHNSIRATFTTMWDILSEEEQAALARLAIFSSTFSAEAARRITNVSPFFLNGLVQHALLWQSPNRRYQCHPLLQQFLREHISQNVLQDLREKFIAYYAAFAERIAGRWRHVPRRESQDAIFLERDNLRQAWRWALEAQDFAHADAMLPLLHHYYEHNGWLQEAYITFTRLLEFLSPNLHEESPLSHRHLYARTLLMLGRYAYHLGLYNEALEYLQRSTLALQTCGVPEDFYAVSEALANLYRVLGEEEKAAEHLQESKRIAERLGNTGFLGDSLSKLALMHYDCGEWDEAEKLFLEALAHHRRNNDETRIAAMLNNLGNVAYERGEYQRARRYLEECLPLAERVEGQTLLAAILDSLGKVFIALQEYNRAWDYLHRGLYICKKANAVPLAMELINNAGYLLAALGDLKTAARLWSIAAAHPQAPATVRERGRLALEEHGLAPLSVPSASLGSLLENIQSAVKTALNAFSSGPLARPVT